MAQRAAKCSNRTTCMHKNRKLCHSSIVGQQAPYNNDDNMAKHGGHSPANRSTETCSVGLQHTSLILNIHVMVGWHLSKQGIR